MRKNQILMTSASPLAMPAIVHMSAYANTLTGLIPDMYAALNVVSRELVGFIPSVARAPGVERAAQGQQVVYDVAPVATASDIAPAMTVPEPADKAPGTGFITISKARKSDFGFVGEEQRGLDTGAGYLTVQGGFIAQALRVLTNEIEADVAAEATAAACRAHGVAGTTPYASGVGDSAQLRKILDDNGAPATGRAIVLNTAAGAAIRTNTQLTKANEAGSQMTLRQGEILDIHGFSHKESGQAVSHTAGTGASATTDTAGYAVGATTINLASAGTGTILAGDVITFAGDANKYVVVTGDADVSGGGSVVIAEPGLRVAIPASATAITVGADYAANVGFSNDAIHLVTRAPALPREGDLAVDRKMVVDPRSGIAFEMSLYPGYRKMMVELGLAWGQKAVKPEHIALLLG